jgi:hypothetical protein
MRATYSTNAQCMKLPVVGRECRWRCSRVQWLSESVVHVGIRRLVLMTSSWEL